MLLRGSSNLSLGSLNFPQADVVKNYDATRNPHGFGNPPPSSCNSPLPLSRFNSFSHPSLHTALVDGSRQAIGEHEGEFASQFWLKRAQSEGDLASMCAASSLMSSISGESESATEINSSRSTQWAKRNTCQYRDSAVCRQDSIMEESESVESGSENYEHGNVECYDESSALIERHRAFGSSDDRNNFLLEPKNLTSETVSVPKAGGKFLLDDGEMYTSLSADANGSPVACNSRGCWPLTKHECEKLGFLVMSSDWELGKGGSYSRGNGWNGQNGGNGSDSQGTDAHYQRLLQADPQNPLLLRNYAQYLIEVKDDRKKCEEYLGRAILACPGDGEVLAQYAKLQWDVHRDQERAESYYDQAVQAAPDDCYVLASHASFLWDSEESEDVIPSSSPLHPALYGASSVPAPVMASASASA